METIKRTTLLALDLIGVPAVLQASWIKIHDQFYNWVHNEGNQGIKRSKEVFSYTLSYLLGENPNPPSWLAMSKKVSGSPKILEAVWTWILENPKSGLTLLRYSDLFTAILEDKNCLDAMAPITGQDVRSKDQPFEEKILEVAGRFRVPTLHVEIGSVPLFTKGPNGISILSLHRDSLALSSEGILDPVMDLGERIASITPGVSTSEMVKSVVREFNEPLNPKLDPRKSSNHVGRVVFLAEKSAKIRVIAQGDYITQSVLKPIHDSLAGILRQIPGDWTFDQEGGKEWVRKKTTTAKWSASYDLSNATDRLPLDLQAKIISTVLPGELGDIWSRVIGERRFTYTLPSGKMGYVKYAVGQPMGFYSSFVSFALLHHCVVNTAFELAHGRPGKNFYAIIGDDMVIFDQAAGTIYLDIIRSIGGVINLKKSRLSTSKDNIIAEFAKAYFRNGVDLTPFSLRAISNGIDNWANVPKLVNDLRRKLGRVIPAKTLKKLIQKYWPNEANSLLQLLEVPELLGGFGKPGTAPLATVLRGNNGNCFRRYLAYRALEAYKCVVDISDEDIDKATSDINDRKQLRIALEPFLRLLRDRQASIGLPHVVTTRKGFLDWALSEDTALSSLISLVTLMTKDLPTSLREKVRRPSVMWVRASADDKRSSTVVTDSDDAYHYAYLELATTA